jgi:predicted Rossmann fold flavoprotein
MTNKKIIVIGGGAAGYFAAIHAAESGGEVILLEKSNKVLSKVKVSGGGRCNVTNVCEEPAILIQNYPRGSKELRGPFSRFHTTHTKNWFELRGVQLKTEIDGRVFPVTNSSQTIIDCLEAEARKNGVQIRLQTSVKKLNSNSRNFEIETESGILAADKIIVATGGSPSLESYKWLSNLGHTIIPPVPSLFTFNIPDKIFTELMGVSVARMRLKISGTNFIQEGPLLFTHWGISGPAVLKLSAWAAQWLYENQYHFKINLNFIPDLNEAEVKTILLTHILKNKLKQVATDKLFDLPLRLWEKLCLLAGVTSNQKWNEIGKSVINKLVNNLTALEIDVKGKTTFKEEFVTCGGVDLSEIYMKTMESKKVPGLYFAGEVLNIDGVTGGFNFQAAWTTGFIAGTSAVK